jgi:dihydrolipoamide dehydrogenase
MHGQALIPGCTYCHPQVASVGLTEAKAKEAGKDIRVGRFPFVANGKAIALGEDQGMVKTIFDKKTGQLLGAHLVGAEVVELIQGFVVAMNLETTEEELIHTVFPHPTMSETMKEACSTPMAGDSQAAGEGTYRQGSSFPNAFFTDTKGESIWT